MHVVESALELRGLARRRGRLLLTLILSLALHGGVLGWFALRQDSATPPSETPAIEVQLVEAPRQARADPTASLSRRADPARTTPDATDPQPRYAAPPTHGAGGEQGGVDLYGPVFADGRWPRPRLVLRRCDPLKDPDLSSPECRREREIDAAVTRNADPANGAGDFAREARHNEALRRYREAPGAAGFPGVRCHILHRC
ncbi:MAG: hypothetical protein JNK30_20105 [Phenylobacterium sp.]|uniref:hypothetical protein n=1 Tax=Phenylobacterium sp. TaxID=1871053 RepID=UPI001A3B2E28|nr:hypothetical protein [Phenylobacterium sp.]MBL8773699.1 hypothetical protein [Phenylobacterium sp.]